MWLWWSWICSEGSRLALLRLLSTAAFSNGRICPTATAIRNAYLEQPTNSPLGQAILPGDTYHFQFWFRDEDSSGVNSANFSNMLSFQFP